jgi:hypothetical protein
VCEGAAAACCVSAARGCRWALLLLLLPLYLLGGLCVMHANSKRRGGGSGMPGPPEHAGIAVSSHRLSTGELNSRRAQEAQHACIICLPLVKSGLEHTCCCSTSIFLRLADLSGRIFGLHSTCCKPPRSETTRPVFGSTGCRRGCCCCCCSCCSSERCDGSAWVHAAERQQQQQHRVSIDGGSRHVSPRWESGGKARRRGCMVMSAGRCPVQSHLLLLRVHQQL